MSLTDAAIVGSVVAALTLVIRRQIGRRERRGQDHVR